MKVELTIGSGMEEKPVTIEEVLDPLSASYVIECGDNKIPLEEFQLKELAHAIKMFLTWDKIDNNHN